MPLLKRSSISKMKCNTTLQNNTEFQCNIFKKTHISANQLRIQLKWKHWSFFEKTKLSYTEFRNKIQQLSELIFRPITHCKSYMKDGKFKCLHRNHKGQNLRYEPLGAGRWQVGVGADALHCQTFHSFQKSGKLYSYVKFPPLKYYQLKDAWVAQSVKRPTLGLGSSHDLTVREFETWVGFCTHSSEPALAALSLPLSAPPPLALSLCLSK